MSRNTFETFATFLPTSRNCETTCYHRDSIACGRGRGRGRRTTESKIQQQQTHSLPTRDVVWRVSHTDMRPVIERLFDDDKGNNITKEDRYAVTISDFVWPRLDRTETRGSLRFRSDGARPV